MGSLTLRIRQKLKNLLQKNLQYHDRGLSSVAQLYLHLLQFFSSTYPEQYDKADLATCFYAALRLFISCIYYQNTGLYNYLH